VFPVRTVRNPLRETKNCTLHLLNPTPKQIKKNNSADHRIRKNQ